MGDSNTNLPPARDESDLNVLSRSASGGEYGPAFHSQLEYLAQQQQLYPVQTNPNAYGHNSFDMGSMTAALPHGGYPPSGARPQHGLNEPHGVFSRASVYQMQQASQFAAGRGSQFDPVAASRQQQQYAGSPYGSWPQQTYMSSRQSVPYQAQGQYGQMDPYSYGFSPVAMSPLDSRFPTYGSYGPGSSYQADPSHFAHRASEPGPVPNFPRGPPRKPKQSGHALWVGNLPPAANVTDLKDHFSRDATRDIESLFLISKSNCAFVNYRSEAACVAAMHRFHDSRFNGVRLVCRLRRGSSTASNALAPPSVDVPDTPSSSESAAETPSPALDDEATSPTIVGNEPLSSSTSQTISPIVSGEDSAKTPDKYFIVKSLTVQDLESSVRNGIWATQSHNEVVLNRAYEEADNVYLIFSANKSGEYFGYARMASRISGTPVNLNSSATEEEVHSPGVPQSIPTPATATAPKGRIIDDSARGTIFWEAEHSSDDDENEISLKESAESGTGQNWGRQFAIEWLSVTRLPFYRTRGLRNPWNANREVKIARDGTELEASVGRRLVQMFHRPSPGPTLPQPNLPLR